MQNSSQMPEVATQELPPEAYTSEEWLAQENKNLFSRSWAFAGTEAKVANAGDYITATAGHFNLVVIRGSDRELRAFHNICRHRGTELLDRGCGNTGKTIVCPYHSWTFGLDGALRGVPEQKSCFPDIDKKENGLHPASVAVFKGLVFVNPEPDQKLSDWLSGLEDVVWPHDITSPELISYDEPVTYEMQCNWKVFFENAIDGYHLAYLHKNTLGGPTQDKNIWDPYGDNQVWYSIENENLRSRVPNFVSTRYDRWEAPKIPHAAQEGYGGVYMLFPTTLIVASPWSFSISVMEPISAGVTRLHVYVWAGKSWISSRGSVEDIPGYDKATGLIKSSHWQVHPLETEDFQTEDIYVVEKMQRALKSPRYAVGKLAAGPGAESPLTFFQRSVVRHMES
ncbi:aromatic ring-hydroxylating oxygenase subunit alpha [Ruegeria arenilitoris]|uniref:aromatic ring-hydroxylating oxygenase subunit alpha n=1 Tax=Ruegeria arenilitoris TaxID=1173585 RepID=UPI00147E3488|nr:aromatic ring-hydroxylating dioxygenase subunit alpha [Ruegeria arenilitoris]